MNLPNKLTVLRVLLVPVFMVLMYVDSKYSYLAALIVFCVASFTDFLDGNIARKYNMVTDFGKFMDPLADKMLTTTAIIYLVKFGFCHEIVLIIVLIREFRVSGIRMIAAAAPGGGKVIAAGLMGKAKTVFQMISIILAFSGLALRDLGVISQISLGSVNIVVNVMMWIMAALTVVSGMQYILPNIDLIRNAK
ncbi:MAG: CDP-diacylglycerol--glycerol-3-phosphate 3-phosphatidyltransferase [Oscillospiraceae bacterium]|nr:CDP-diacylglycerol--glycerol-3-phosphate 3-phosphatidyltransferase [Oscillospiraceae bacterium]